jgi:hypothetical protein
MSSPLRFRQTRPLIPLLAAFVIAGCGVGTTPTQTPPDAASLTGNWQIQQYSSITTPPIGPSLLGALQVQGSQVTGTFYTTPICSNPVTVSYTGSYDSSTGNLTLTAVQVQPIPVQVQLAIPTDPATIATGTMIAPASLPGDTFGCDLKPITGPAVGVEIAPLNGTYTGTLTDSANPSFSGPATLVLTQSSTPNSNGAFPLTGTLTFPASSNLGTYTLTGTVSGEGIALSFSSPAVIGPAISLTASTNPAASQITVTNLAFLGGGIDISATFTGTLTLQ